MYLFTRTGATWRQQAYIKGSNTEAFDEFGGSVALDRTGRILVAAAPGEDGATTGVDVSLAEQCRRGRGRRLRLRRDALKDRA